MTGAHPKTAVDNISNIKIFPRTDFGVKKWPRNVNFRNILSQFNASLYFLIKWVRK